jgi:hypothetical protein
MALPIYCAYDDLVPIDQLQPHPQNIREHYSFQLERLVELLRYHGWRQPITVSRLSNYVIRGHGTLEAARLLGEERVPVDYQEYQTTAEELSDLIADYTSVIGRDYDVDMLLQTIDEHLPPDQYWQAGYVIDEIDVLRSVTSGELSNKPVIDHASNDNDTEYVIELTIPVALYGKLNQALRRIHKRPSKAMKILIDRLYQECRDGDCNANE